MYKAYKTKYLYTECIKKNNYNNNNNDKRGGHAGKRY